MVGSKKVPKGLSKGTLGMCPGEIREVNIPSHLGYGDEEKGKNIFKELNMVHCLLDDCICYNTAWMRKGIELVV